MARPPETRLDIQALRAVAVLLVVVFHFFPSWLPGGYVGVDAFFVVSGYLITLHLKRELESKGTIALGAFWARRARRLLPASLLVLSVTLLGVVTLVPLSLWQQFAQEILASAAYFENFRLAADAIAYSTAENDPSPVQHFWSLSVEEQFYLGWPVMLLLSSLAGRGGFRGVVLRARAVLVLVIAASLAYSIWATDRDPTSAYYNTLTRSWEFASGALLAFAKLPRPAPKVAAAVAWSSLLLLVGAAVTYSSKTPFPGWLAALPVVGTLGVIAFGSEGGGASIARLLGVRPVVWLGDHSYGVYLWHWPPLVIARVVLGRELSLGESAAMLSGVLALSYLTKRFVEDPVRHARPLVERRAAWTFALVALGTALVWFGTDRATRYQARKVAAVSPIAKRAKTRVVPCFGAAAKVSRSPCKSPVPDDQVVPAPISAKLDAVGACLTDKQKSRLKVCEFGDAKSELVVGLLGDSHAAHWYPALQQLARKHDFRLLTFLKGSCPYSEARRDTNRAVSESCERWKDEVDEELERRDEIDVLFVSASSKNSFEEAPTKDATESAVRGFVSAWSDLPKNIRHVVALRDIPRPREDVVLCLEREERLGTDVDDGACALSRGAALLDDPLAAAGRQSERATVIDFTDVFCDRELCYPVVGDALVYRDEHHMTATFARTLAPLLDRELRRQVRAFRRL